MVMGKRSKNDVIVELRRMLADAFRLRNEGGVHAKLARAHGYIDGYMRVLLDSGMVTKAELMQIVAEERNRADGPATQVLSARVA